MSVCMPINVEKVMKKKEIEIEKDEQINWSKIKNKKWKRN